MGTCIDGNLSGIHKHEKVVGVGKITFMVFTLCYLLF